MHFDVIYGGTAVSHVVTAVSMHDSSLAIPLATMTARHVANLYDLMDGAYDAKEIRDCSEELGHVPIIVFNDRNRKDLKVEREVRKQRRLGLQSPEARRYRQRARSE